MQTESEGIEKPILCKLSEKQNDKTTNWGNHTYIQQNKLKRKTVASDKEGYT